MKYTKERPVFQKYIINMSSGKPIPIDEDELEKVMRGIGNGQPVKLRQGIFNPSFYSSIVIDEDRYEEWKYHITSKINDDGHVEVYYPIPEKLPDIFANILEAPRTKQLNEYTRTKQPNTGNEKEIQTQ